MSRLICLDLAANPEVLLRGKQYTVYANPLRPPLVTLRESDGGASELPMTRNELPTLIGKEVATLVDALDEPEEDEPTDQNSGKAMRARRACTDISHLTLHRIVDWHAKMFMLIRLLPLRGASPKGKVFAETVKRAHEELAMWWNEMGIHGEGKNLSAWTLYHIVLTWRKRRYAMAAFQRKGVEYSPWLKRSLLLETAKGLATAFKLNNPTWTTQKIREEVEKSLAANQHLIQGNT
jgi:hypothetical protein